MSINPIPTLEQKIKSYNADRDRLATSAIAYFAEFFRENKPSRQAPYRFHSITSGADLCTNERGKTRRGGVLPGKGFYLILSDYQPSWDYQNQCGLSVKGEEGLRVLYRGQADKVKERLESHLFNHQYKTRLNGKGWERSLKLDEVASNKGGINIDEAPFDGAKWVIIILPMPNSTSEMRVLTEWGFDEVWGKPIACKETKKNTHNISEARQDELNIEASS